LAVVLLGTAVAGLGAGAQPGQLVQLSGPGACVSQLVTDGICAEARALNGPDALAVSPDGRSVYVASSGVAPNVAGNSGSIAGFARDAATGRIAQPAGAAGCVGDLDDGCGEARGIEVTSAVAVSGDGRSVYATGFGSDAVAVFARSPNGSLTQLAGAGGCVAAGESEGCAVGPGLRGAADLAIAGGGANVYVASFRSNAIASFARDTRTGRLRQLAGDAACIAEQESEREDGESTVVESCRPGKALTGATTVTTSPDGRSVYVLARDAIATFRRAPGGGLTQLPGSISAFRRDSSSGALSPMAALASSALDGVAGLTITPGGDGLYAVSPYQDAVLAFTRKADGRLDQPRGAAACVSDVERTDSCMHAQVLSRASAAGVSPDGRHLYVSSVEPIGVSCACGRELGSLSVFTRKSPAVSLGRPARGAPVRAGRPFRITTTVRTSARPVKVSCAVGVGGQLVRAAASYAAGTAVCSGVVPGGLAGSRLAGTVKVTAGGATRTARFSFPIG
jgi:6-phosphogluconolactonase (cycloisomerase 2 family)